MVITRISTPGLELIKRFEGFRSSPYLCPSGVATIGYGTTYYEDGRKVRIQDPDIDEARATELLIHVLETFETMVKSFTRDDLNQNQFDALTSFCYNVGPGALKSSTLLKKVNDDPYDPAIEEEFLRWNKGGGKVLKGLTDRRRAEAGLYFS